MSNQLIAFLLLCCAGTCFVAWDAYATQKKRGKLPWKSE
jgi:hypothetical protein